MALHTNASQPFSGRSSNPRFTMRFHVALFAVILSALALLRSWTALAVSSEEVASQATYVGPETCGGCHPENLKSFREKSGKAATMDEVKQIPGLSYEESQGCLACHTTGYGKPGGFRSASETPELLNPGCESCHGPGSAHCESGGDTKFIVGKPTLKICEGCHDSLKVEPVKFKGHVWKAH